MGSACVGRRQRGDVMEQATLSTVSSHPLDSCMLLCSCFACSDLFLGLAQQSSSCAASTAQACDFGFRVGGLGSHACNWQPEPLEPSLPLLRDRTSGSSDRQSQECLAKLFKDSTTPEVTSHALADTLESGARVQAAWRWHLLGSGASPGCCQKQLHALDRAPHTQG